MVKHDANIVFFHLPAIAGDVFYNIVPPTGSTLHAHYWTLMLKTSASAFRHGGKKISEPFDPLTITFPADTLLSGNYGVLGYQSDDKLNYASQTNKKLTHSDI